MAKVRRIRWIIFLREVLVLAVTAFGGPQAHVAMMFERLVERRGYLTEDELIELNALCSILPGPTSTQTITAIGYRLGGPNLAYLTLLVWCLPAVSAMIFIALIITQLDAQGVSLGFARYIQPMAVGIIAYAGYKIATRVVTTGRGIVLMVLAALIAYAAALLFRGELWVSILYPVLLLAGGFVTGTDYKKQEQVALEPLKIHWGNFIVWIGVFAGAALLGNLLSSKLILLFENFYRNGSLVFGGGQVLIPLMKVEFVDYKHFLTEEQFLTGIATGQAMPGPVFSVSGYLGALSMQDRGPAMQFAAGWISAAGLFLPGTFLIFFVYRFWAQLKQYRTVRAALEGVNAVSCGLILSVAVVLLEPYELLLPRFDGFLNLGLVVATFLVLLLTKIPVPFLILGGLMAGVIVEYF